MDTRHPRRLLAPEQVLMRFSIIYDRPSTNLACAPAAIWWMYNEINRTDCLNLRNANLSGADVRFADLAAPTRMVRMSPRSN